MQKQWWFSQFVFYLILFTIHGGFSKEVGPDCDVLHDSFCYDLVHSCKTYEEARIFCEEAGATLASIPNKMVNLELSRLVTDNTFFGPFIGLSDKAEEGKWLWEDGSTLAYTNWMDGEPNSYGGDEDCAAMIGKGTWIDIGCEAPLPFICKYDSSSTYNGNTADETQDAYNTQDEDESCLSWDQIGDAEDYEEMASMFLINFLSSLLAGLVCLVAFWCCFCVYLSRKSLIERRVGSNGEDSLGRFTELPLV